MGTGQGKNIIFLRFIEKNSSMAAPPMGTGQRKKKLFFYLKIFEKTFKIFCIFKKSGQPAAGPPPCIFYKSHLGFLVLRGRHYAVSGQHTTQNIT